MINLRWYQEKAIDIVRKKYAAGTKRILLVAPTGSGKTVIFSHILKSCLDRGNQAIMVVRGRGLVDQASDRLSAYGIRHGVMMAGHWNRNEFEPIQVCSIDTLYSRKIAPPAAVVVIDEAHTAAGASYRWLLQHYHGAFFLPVTATPYNKRGFRHIADDYVEVASMQELIDAGYLCPLKYYTPTTIDVSAVEVSSTGDYNSKQLFAAANTSTIYGDIVRTYKEMNNRSALAFCVNVDHSKRMADAFNSAGVSAEHVDAETTLYSRKDIIERLINGQTKVVCSVGTMTTGVDIPSLESLIIARPTRSLNLHIQMLGRATRISTGKPHAVIFDHAGNIMAHGLAESRRPVSLDGFTPNKSEPKPLACKKCLAMFCPVETSSTNKRNYVCPSCGHDNTPERAERAESETVDASMSELTVEQRTKLEIKIRHDEIESLRSKTRKKTGEKYDWRWTFHQLMGEYDWKLLAELYPGKMKAMSWRQHTRS